VGVEPLPVPLDEVGEVVAAKPVARGLGVRIAGGVPLHPAVHLGRGLPPALAAASVLGLLDQPDGGELAEVIARRTGVRGEALGEGGGGRGSVLAQGRQEARPERVREHLETTRIEAKDALQRFRCALLAIFAAGVTPAEA